MEGNELEGIEIQDDRKRIGGKQIGSKQYHENINIRREYQHMLPKKSHERIDENISMSNIDIMGENKNP